MIFLREQKTQPNARQDKNAGRRLLHTPDCKSMSLLRKSEFAFASYATTRESQSSGKIFTCDKWLIKFPAQPRRWRRKKWNARRKKWRVLCFVVAAFKLKNEKVRAGWGQKVASGNCFAESLSLHTLLRTFLRGAFFGGRQPTQRPFLVWVPPGCNATRAALFAPLFQSRHYMVGAMCARFLRPALSHSQREWERESGYLLINTHCVCMCALCTNIN